MDERRVPAFNFLRTLWPIPFKVKKHHLGSFLWRLICFIVVAALFGILMGVLANIPVVGIIFSIVGSLMDAYCVVGVVLCILKFVGVIKD